jgi:hypothetical protein
MPWLLLRKFWPIIVGTLALLALGVWHANLIKKARADERQKITLTYQKALQDVITKREERVAEVRHDYQAKINRLSQSVAIELRGSPIRMCPPAVSVSAPQDPGGLAGSAGGEPTVRTPPDLRPLIVHRGETCEKLREKLIAIKALQD